MLTIKRHQPRIPLTIDLPPCRRYIHEQKGPSIAYWTPASGSRRSTRPAAMVFRPRPVRTHTDSSIECWQTVRQRDTSPYEREKP